LKTASQSRDIRQHENRPISHSHIENANPSFEKLPPSSACHAASLSIDAPLQL